MVNQNKKLNFRLIHTLRNLDYFIYRRKHLIFYILIGIFSIYAELNLRSFILSYNFNVFFASSSSLIVGIFISFILNFYLNFNVPKYFFYRSLLYFVTISVLSYMSQYLIKIYLNINYLSFENSRFLYSGIFFIIGYFFHIKFTFKDKRIVGVAIYSNKQVNNYEIHKKIGQYPDFIHIDIIDESFKKNLPAVDIEKINEINKIWPYHNIDLHIMSLYPLKYLDRNINNVSNVYFHYEINQNIDEVIRKIKKLGSNPGIVLHAKYKYKNIDKIISKFNQVLILCIENPGYSGQIFLESSYNLINTVNRFRNKKNIKICVDGGVNIKNINLFNCEKIVSASDILNSNKPKRKIMSLQTLSRYEKKIIKN